MKILQQVWEDIKHGENLDLYLTIVISITLTLLSLLSITPVNLLSSITLTVLVLIAISNLANRHKLDLILQKEIAETLFLTDFPPNLKDDFASATKEVWLGGHNLGRTVVSFDSLIERSLRHGCKVNVLLVHPNGSANKLVSEQTYGGIDEKEHATQVNLSITRLLRLAQRVTPGQLEIRLINFPISFGFFAFDIGGATGKLFLEHYSFRQQRDIPKFVLTPKNGYWFECFKNEILSMWESGVAHTDVS